MNPLEFIPVPSPDVVGRLVNGEAVLVLPVRGQVKVLNQVGAGIWSLIDGARSVGEIARLIYQEYQVDLAQAENDCQDFIRELADKGVVTLR